MKKAKDIKKQGDSNVKAVEDAWTNVKGDFETLCKELIKQYANEVDTKATVLQRSASVANAQKFKDTGTSTIEIKDTGTGNNKTITITNLPHINNTFTPRYEKFIWIIIPSMVTMWSDFITCVILLVVYVTSIPSMLLGNLMEYGLKGYYLDQEYKPGHWKTNETHHYNLVPKDKATEDTNTDDYGNNTLASKEIKFSAIIVPSIVAQWLKFLTFVLLLVVYETGL